jgi:ABC-2 type transport system permease protein
MLRTVYRLEWRNAWRDTASRAVVAVLVLLVVYAAVGGSRVVSIERDALTTAQRDDVARMTELRRELKTIAGGAEVKNVADPRNALQVGRELAPRIAALPPGPLAVIAVGQRDVLPTIIELTTKTRLDGVGHDDGASPLKQSNGPFDLAFVFVFLLPLIVIALSYDLLSGERERGTLSLVLSQPITLMTFVLGKGLQRAALLLLLVLVLGLLAPMASGANMTVSGGPLRMLLYLSLLGLYSMFWLALAVLVNSWGRSSAANALTLVGFWLALLVVLPGLASVAVDAIYPSPSRVELVNLARAAASDAESRTTAVEGDHGKPAETLSARRAIDMQAALDKQLEPVLMRFREQHRRQQAMVDKLRFLSPAIVLNEGLSDIAGSSVGRHQHFSAQVDVFHTQMKRFFAERVQRGTPLTSDDYDAMPQFVYEEPPDKELAQRVGASLLALALAAAALLALAAARLRTSRASG